jgi:hypothetical protein
MKQKLVNKVGKKEELSSSMDIMDIGTFAKLLKDILELRFSQNIFQFQSNKIFHNLNILIKGEY